MGRNVDFVFFKCGFKKMLAIKQDWYKYCVIREYILYMQILYKFVRVKHDYQKQKDRNDMERRLI